MATLTISITDSQKDFLQDMVNSGQYGNISEVIREAIRFIYKQQSQDFLKEIRLGLQDFEDGNIVEFADSKGLNDHIQDLYNKSKKRKKSSTI